MRKAIIENGIVTNIIVEHDDEENPQGIQVDGLSVGVGDIYDGANFSKPQPSAEQIKAAALTELTEMEREALMPRVTREFLITATLMQAAQLGISQASPLDPLDPAFSPGFAKMWVFNERTKVLRAKL